jgi:polysaccharide pyruvyl transferase WcaK-like protein
MIKKILIVNTHSALNAGDAAIVLAQIRYLRKTFGPVDISLASRTPNLDRKVYASEKISVFAPLFKAPGAHSGNWAKITNSARGLAGFGLGKELRQAVREADLVVASGGGYFWSHGHGIPGPTFGQNIMHLRVASRMGKPIVVFPQSFGPLFGAIPRRISRLIEKRLG